MATIKIPTLSQKEIETFSSRVERSDSCWRWVGPSSRGYGYQSVRGRHYRAHRIAWALAFGDPGEQLVCHSCDNPPCCNPEHLFLGSIADNTADMIRKGRNARGDRHGAHTRPERLARGDRHGSQTHPERLMRGDRHYLRLHPEKAWANTPGAKLTTSQVAEIKRDYSHGLGGFMAEKYNVSRATISMIVNHKIWKHQ